MSRIVPLTQARKITKGRGIILTDIRADIGDYGPPGAHFHGPLALGLLKQKGGGKLLQLSPAEAAEAGADDLAAALCNPLNQGGTIAFGDSMAASTTSVQVSAQQSRPFIILHIYATGDSAYADGTFFRLKVAQDNDTIGGQLVNGTDIDSQQSIGPGWNLGNPEREFYPNFVVLIVPAFIKCIFINGAGAARRLQVGVSIKYLS